MESTLFGTDGVSISAVFVYDGNKKGTITHLMTCGNCPPERNLIHMTNDISFLTGINDPDLKIDKSDVEDIGTYKVIHLVVIGLFVAGQCLRTAIAVNR